MSHSNCKWWRG